MPRNSPDAVRHDVLARMERGEKVTKLAIIGAAMLEAALMAFAILYMDWTVKLQVQLFVFSVIGYTIIVLGMVALAGHISRSVGRVLAALDARE